MYVRGGGNNDDEDPGMADGTVGIGYGPELSHGHCLDTG